MSFKIDRHGDMKQSPKESFVMDSVEWKQAAKNIQWFLTELEPCKNLKLKE